MDHDVFAYRDAFGSVAKVHPVVDQWSSHHGNFAKWADEALDDRGSCAVPTVAIAGRDDPRPGSRLERALALVAGVVAKGVEKPVHGLRSASQRHLDWREHRAYGFMVREERKKWVNGHIPDGLFERICEQEIAALRKMG